MNEQSVFLQTVINLVGFSVLAIIFLSLIARERLEKTQTIFICKIAVGIVTFVAMLATGVKSALLIQKIAADAGGFFHLPFIWLPLTLVLVPIILVILIKSFTKILPPGNSVLRWLVAVFASFYTVAYFIVYSAFRFIGR